MTLNSLPVQRLAEVVANLSLRPSAVTAKCPKSALPLRPERKTVPTSQPQAVPFPVFILLICGLLAQHPEVPVVDCKGFGNQLPIVTP